jgi:hypothetical protein
MMELNECTRTLWGSRLTFHPYLLDKVFGDGHQWVKFWPMNYRPLFYLVRVDQTWNLYDDLQDDGSFRYYTDDIVDAIENELGSYGDLDEEDEGPLDGFERWPIPVPQTFMGWCWGPIDQHELRELIP